MVTAPYLIDEILPAWSVHLLGGISDAGKTRWILPTLIDWAQGKPVLGLASHPVPWVYVAADRPLHEAEASIASMGLSNIEIIPGFGQHNKSWFQIKAAIMASGCGLAVIEGFGDFVNPPGHKHQVREFLSDLSACCAPCRDHPDGITIIGIMESPKLKPHEYYRDVRQRISGVASWGFHSSTVLLIETLKPDFSTTIPGRMLYIRTKGFLGRDIEGSFDSQGRLHFP